MNKTKSIIEDKAKKIISEIGDLVEMMDEENIIDISKILTTISAANISFVLATLQKEGWDPYFDLLRQSSEESLGVVNKKMRNKHEH